MAEHQTENLGVRGSIPFIGIMLYNIYIYYFLLFKNKKYINNIKMLNMYNILFILQHYNLIIININKQNINNFSIIHKGEYKTTNNKI